MLMSNGAKMSKIFNSYVEALDELKNIASEAYDLGDLDTWREIEEKAEILKYWIDNGQSDQCPVDMHAYDIEVTAPHEKVISEDDFKGELIIEDEKFAFPEPFVEELPVTINKNVEKSDEKSSSSLELELDDQAETSLGLAEEEHTGEKLEEEDSLNSSEYDESGIVSESHSDLDSVEIIDDTATEIQDEDKRVNIETPEQIGLRRQLEEATSYFEAGQIRQALNLSKLIEERATDTDIKNSSIELRDRSQYLLNSKLTEALEHGDKARHAGEEEEARKYYRVAQELDPENKHAREALIELNGVIKSAELSQAELNRLRAGLKEQRDIKKLGDAVYQAEALDVEGKLGEEFVGLLKSARDYYDDLRTEMGQETTMARFGDLDAKNRAWELARDKLNKGINTYYHSVLDKYVPTVEYVEEAHRLYEEKSAETAAYELEIAKVSLPDNPKGASDRLSKALELPFMAQHVGTLEKWYQNVQTLIAEKQDAEQKLEQAAKSEDPVEIFNLVRSAFESFPHIKGLKPRLVQARQTAIDTLVARMESHHRKVDVLLKSDTKEAYEQARDEVAMADQIAARWPEEKTPEKLGEYLRIGQDWIERISARQTLRNEFESRIKVIRQQVSDPDRRQAGRQLFRDLKDDKRFSNFTELRSLISEMDQYAGLGEQLAEARSEKLKGNWDRVYELADKMKMGGQAGQLSKEIDVLFNEAIIELDIRRVQRFVQEKSFIEAISTIDRINASAKNKEQLEAIEGRLSDELAIIDVCKANTAPFEKLFNQGLGFIGFTDNSFVKVLLNHEIDRSKPAEIIAGLSETGIAKIKKNLPDSKNSTLSIQEAMDGAYLDLMEQLAQKNIQNRIRALKVFRFIQGNPVAIEADWPEFQVSLITKDAGRMARLLTDSLRSGVLSAIHEAYFSDETEKLSEAQIKTYAQYARSLRQVELLETESEREAARWFDVEQGRREAEERESSGDWDSALKTWEALSLRHPGDNRVQRGITRALKKKETIDTVLKDADAAVNQGRRIHALRTLTKAMESGPTKDEAKLKEKFDLIVRDAQMELLDVAEGEGKKHDQESISHAVLALHELREIETLCELPEDQCSSLTELEAIHMRLEETQPDLADQFDRLGDLYNLLQEADALKLNSSADGEFDGIDSGSAFEGSKWDQAVQKGKFEELEGYWKLIMELDLMSNPMAIDFRIRLDEYKAVCLQLQDDIRQIRDRFSGNEDFEGVLRILKNNTLLTGNREWRSLQQDDYQRIRQLMSDKLLAINLFGDSGNNHIIGWDNVEANANLRKEELDLWQSWDQECVRLMGSATGKISSARDRFESLTLTEKQSVMEEAISAIIRVIELLELGPQKDGIKASVHSNKASSIRDDGRDRLTKAKEWLYTSTLQLKSIISEIYSSGGFPTPDEFHRAAELAGMKDFMSLRLLVERGKSVGPGNTILSMSDFRFFAVQAGKGNLIPLKHFLECIEELNVGDFPTSERLRELTTSNDSEQAKNFLSKIERGFSYMELINDINLQAENAIFKEMKNFLRYSTKLRASRREEEQKRLELYSRVLQREQMKKTTIFDWFRKLLGL